MKLSDFDFDLPEDRIALRPARPRDSARLLYIPAEGPFGDLGVLDLPSLLQPGDLLVFNDTRVLPAALSGIRPARDEGGQDVTVLVNLHQRSGPDGWRAFVKPGKRLRQGDVIRFGAFEAQLESKSESGDVILRFGLSGQELDAAIEAAGAPPLPPYIASKRGVDVADEADYQTIFADPEKTESVAAPTAGLHFTEGLMEALRARGVAMTKVTLHVGAGTFLPVKTENVSEHKMHSEWCEISDSAAAAINAAKARGKRVVPVGTTALRTLESLAEGYGVRAGTMDTDIFITPGYEFRVTDALMTNFHLPKSTLFMLVSALAGLDRMQAAYAHAIARNYRFFSYGDACLIEKA
ncbi:tRNA preQ1(34) S-adenosylmethionine ribosyltransferase-isomerase QueA [Hyphobacterium sp. HN65]|uniref:S-adenosylmethionine:tRNA ribosyltransferase-isomerase n=1 Tax=Hyphobacterium lacteum TaxID=3116575 RepID=A0ABU7LTB8_9PROT|nr:tRNA preQ1(34) S-adenosylmethionine ribosyltransferase-isomerase QueA [Hyphobacterium sp. HN65]MEE2527165.1 tRNA preQ1(34) S-adenosylmethionine ribosyltransferase-isomerase QueA [Hyphobacterium sp. HN65]